MDVAQNPIIQPNNVASSADGLVVVGTFNPAAFVWRGRHYLLVRVAERAEEVEGYVSVTSGKGSAYEVRRFSLTDPQLRTQDKRFFMVGREVYYTTRSHLRLARTDDNLHYSLDQWPILEGDGELESYGIEDPRVTQIGDTYYITYTAVSPTGAGVGLITTADWQQFQRLGMIFLPTNKNCVLFPERSGAELLALHRPSGRGLMANNIWIATSPDGTHWGDYQCVAKTRPKWWDSLRLGIGPPPLRIADGWLVLYYGVDATRCYRVGAMLLDVDNPAIVLARSRQPLMEPTHDYEVSGFMPFVIFPSGAILEGSEIYLYHGGGDSVCCLAKLDLVDVLATLE